MKQGKWTWKQWNERGWNTHSKRERVKIPLLPYRVGKRSGTMVTTQGIDKWRVKNQQWRDYEKCSTGITLTKLMSMLFLKFFDQAVHVTPLWLVNFIFHRFWLIGLAAITGVFLLYRISVILGSQIRVALIVARVIFFFNLSYNFT